MSEAGSWTRLLFAAWVFISAVSEVGAAVHRTILMIEGAGRSLALTLAFAFPAFAL